MVNEPLKKVTKNKHPDDKDKDDNYEYDNLLEEEDQQADLN